MCGGFEGDLPKHYHGGWNHFPSLLKERVITEFRRTWGSPKGEVSMWWVLAEIIWVEVKSITLSIGTGISIIIPSSHKSSISSCIHSLGPNQWTMLRSASRHVDEHGMWYQIKKPPRVWRYVYCSPYPFPVHIPGDLITKGKVAWKEFPFPKPWVPNLPRLLPAEGSSLAA